MNRKLSSFRLVDLLILFVLFLTPLARLNVFPNPFNPLTRIAVFLPDQHSGQCSIYNSRGELVYQYAPQSFNEGWNYLSWNGTDARPAIISG